MTRILLAILALSISAQTLTQDLDLSWIDKEANLKAHSLEQKFKSLNTTVGNEYDLTYVRALWDIDPAVRYITGSITSYYRVLTEPPHRLTFDMHDSLTVNIIRYHGEALETFTHENHVLTIELPEAMAYGTIDSIMVDYEGAPVEDGLGSFSVDEHNGVPILATLSEPYGAKDWWPCKQNLNDKIDSVLVVASCPIGYKTASIGVLDSVCICHDKYTMCWKHNHPIATYLISLTCTNYEEYSDFVYLEQSYSTKGQAKGRQTGQRPPDSPQGVGPIEILNYIYPEDLEDVKQKTPGLIEVFHIFNDLFGLYPYADEKYGHAQWNYGGGMEHQTMSSMGSFGHDLMAHELAHQWFGDYVTCGSWKDIWLNEGFATYLTGLTYERMFDGIYWEPFKRLSIKRVMEETDGSVYCPDTTDVYRIFDARLSYSKGAMVLHSLRWEMGDQAFFQGIRNYYNAFADDYALTTDLQFHLEAVADTSFQEFFNDWIYGEGYPEYIMNYAQDPSGRVDIIITQFQSHESVDFFEMHVPIQFIGPEIDTTIVFHHIENHQQFSINPDGIIHDAIFDPERWIITQDPTVLNTSKTPLDQEIKLYPNPVGDELNIEVPFTSEEVEISIFNEIGQVVYNHRLIDSQLINVDIGNLLSGVYFVEIVIGEASTVRKVVKR